MKFCYYITAFLTLSISLFQVVNGQAPQPKKVVVQVGSKDSKYFGIPHGGGFYLKKGYTSVKIISDNKVSDFEIKEELDLFAVQSFGDSLFLIFIAVYEPGRGFLVYQSKSRGAFEPILTSKLPLEVAAPNYGAYKVEKELLLKPDIQLSESLLKTRSVRLWSQIITGKSYLPWGVDATEVAVVWKDKKWLGAFSRTEIVEQK